MKTIHKMITSAIAIIWLVNGLFCKVLNLVPRHEQIVSEISGNDYSSSLTLLIGIAEVLTSIWIISAIKPKLNAITQILIVATMNVLEFLLVPDLLLWGKLNILFASIFIIVVYYNGFILNKKTS